MIKSLKLDGSGLIIHVIWGRKTPGAAPGVLWDIESTEFGAPTPCLGYQLGLRGAVEAAAERVIQVLEADIERVRQWAKENSSE